MDSHNTPNARAVHFDVMRIVACFLVIYNHITGFHRFLNDVNEFRIPYIIVSVITKINVPLFFMVSGALLLSRRESIRYVYRHRAIKIVADILLVSTILYLGSVVNSSEQFSLQSLIHGILKNGFTIEYWFLYAYLGFLLFLPLYQRMAYGFSKEDFLSLIGIHFFMSSFLPILNTVVTAAGQDAYSFTSSFSVPLATTYSLFFPLIGYYLDKEIKVETIRKQSFFFLLLLSAACIAASTICTLYQGHTTGTFTQNYLQLFDYVLAIAAFLLIKYISQHNKYLSNTQSRVHRAAVFVSSLTLGIYLFDPILRRAVYGLFYRLFDPYTDAFTLSILWCFISMFVCGLYTFILKKTPFKHLL